MNAEAPARRSRWRWVWAFTFLFLAHVGLVFWLNQRTPAVAPVEKPRAFIHLAADPRAAREIARLSGASDPALFALPSERGFSGKAWLNFSPDNVALSNWSAAPVWLRMPVADLGSVIVQAARTNQVSVDGLLDDLRPVTPFELRIPAEALSTRSSFSIEGQLAGRALITPPALSAVTNSDVIGRSVVELAVNGDGVVESVVITAESGLKWADEAAITAARNLLFAPLRERRPERDRVSMRGRVVFAWHVVPALSTNSLTSVNP